MVGAGLESKAAQVNAAGKRSDHLPQQPETGLILSIAALLCRGPPPPLVDASLRLLRGLQKRARPEGACRGRRASARQQRCRSAPQSTGWTWW